MVYPHSGVEQRVNTRNEVLIKHNSVVGDSWIMEVFFDTFLKMIFISFSFSFET